MFIIPDLSIIIPAYNEEEYICRTLDFLVIFLDSHSYRYELIIVDDGSTDQTANAVSNWKHLTAANLRLFVNERNMGKGFAVQRGVFESIGHFVIFLDSDLPYELQAIEEFLNALQNCGYDLAIGSRVMPGSLIRGVPVSRLLAGKVFSWMISMLVLRGIPDTQCGFKAFTNHAANEIFRRVRIPGFGFDVELLYVANKLGFVIQHVPVRMMPLQKKNSRVNLFRDPIRMFIDLFTIRWNDFKRKYD